MGLLNDKHSIICQVFPCHSGDGHRPLDYVNRFFELCPPVLSTPSSRWCLTRQLLIGGPHAGAEALDGIQMLLDSLLRSFCLIAAQLVYFRWHIRERAKAALLANQLAPGE